MFLYARPSWIEILNNKIQIRAMLRFEWERQTTGESQTNVTNATMHLLGQAIWVHIQKHTLEKSQNKCSQCDFAFSRAGDLRRHLKTHSGEKSYKCNQCDFASSYAKFWEHIWKRTVGKRQTNATSATMPSLMQAIWGSIWKCIVEKSQTNATSVILHPLR